MTSRTKWLVAAGAVGTAVGGLFASGLWRSASAVTIGGFLWDFWSRPFSTVGSFGATLMLAVKALILVLVLWLATRAISKMIRARLLDRTPLDEGHKFALQRIIAYTLFAVGATSALNAFGLDLSGVAVFSGGLGIGVGLGFQTIAKDFASGLILLFEQPVKVGDRVQVGSLQGSIVTIGSRATCVRTNDNVVIVVPNSEFIEQRVTNLTLDDRFVRIKVPFGVSYSSDPEVVRSLATEVASVHPDVLESPEPDVIFRGFGDSSLDFELRIWTTRQIERPQVITSDMYFGLFASLKAHGIEIPFPQRDLHLRSAEAVEPYLAALGSRGTSGESPRPPGADGSAGRSAAPGAGPSQRPEAPFNRGERLDWPS